MYTDCGERALYDENQGQPALLLQQGDYNCVFEHINQKDCFHYPAEKWVTFYYQVSIGHWGKPDSTINAWAALEEQPYKPGNNHTRQDLFSAPGSDLPVISDGIDIKFFRDSLFAFKSACFASRACCAYDGIFSGVFGSDLVSGVQSVSCSCGDHFGCYDRRWDHTTVRRRARRDACS